MINLTAMDMGLSIGFFAIFALFGSLNYATIFNLAPHVNEIAITIIGLLLLMGAMAKSAQIPLHSWLPGSMEGPTPVSALIHAATLVTAGLYLLVRSSPILEYCPTTLLIITLIGSTTAFVAALCGLVQNDIKRIIAFSTISQLGYFISIITFILCLNYLSTASSFVSNLYFLDLYILLGDLIENTMWGQTLYLEDLYLCVYVLEVYFSLVILNYIINYLNSVLLSLRASLKTQDLKYFLTINSLFPSVEPCYLKNVSTDNCNLLFVNLSSKTKANQLSNYLINTKSISSSDNGKLGPSLPIRRVDTKLVNIGKFPYQQ